MKNVRAPGLFATGDMSGSFVTAAINSGIGRDGILQQDDLGIQINYSTGSSPVGAFSIEASIDGTNYATVPVTISGTTTSTIAIPGNASPIIIEFDSVVAAPWVRVRYARTSGSATATVYTTSKRLGD